MQHLLSHEPLQKNDKSRYKRSTRIEQHWQQHLGKDSQQITRGLANLIMRFLGRYPKLLIAFIQFSQIQSQIGKYITVQTAVVAIRRQKHRGQSDKQNLLGKQNAYSNYEQEKKTKRSSFSSKTENMCQFVYLTSHQLPQRMSHLVLPHPEPVVQPLKQHGQA